MPGPLRTIGCPHPALQPARIRRADQDGGLADASSPAGTKGRGQRMMFTAPVTAVCYAGSLILGCPEGATPSGRSPGRSVAILGREDFDSCAEFSWRVCGVRVMRSRAWVQ